MDKEWNIWTFFASLPSRKSRFSACFPPWNAKRLKKCFPQPISRSPQPPLLCRSELKELTQSDMSFSKEDMRKVRADSAARTSRMIARHIQYAALFVEMVDPISRKKPNYSVKSRCLLRDITFRDFWVECCPDLEPSPHSHKPRPLQPATHHHLPSPQSTIAQHPREAPRRHVPPADARKLRLRVAATLRCTVASNPSTRHPLRWQSFCNPATLSSDTTNSQMTQHE